ncbi:hypothetical protein BC332_25628 [Capsicum chinense]|nr:hypothetical protein BC332_25628 [Capsicum chinense]
MKRQMSLGGGERKKGKDSYGKRGDSPLHLAARAGNLGKVKEIFQKFEGKGIKDLLCQQNKKDETALYVAAENGNSLVVSEFLKYLSLKNASIVANNGDWLAHSKTRNIYNMQTFRLYPCEAKIWCFIKENEKMESLLGENGKRFCIFRAALSMMGTPKLGYLVEIVDECAVLVCLNVVLGLISVLTKIDDWSRSSPVVMEQRQEALSCMYYLLQ